MCARRYLSSASTLAYIEMVLPYRAGLLYIRPIRCDTKEAGPWHDLQIVRKSSRKNKARYFYCPRCSSAGRMVYLLGMGTRDVCCEHCVPLQSVNSLLKSKRTREIGAAIDRCDYNYLGSVLSGGYEDLLSYQLASRERGFLRNKEKLIPDMLSTEGRHDKFIKKLLKKDFVRVFRTTGRLLYADGSFIIR